MTGLTGAVKEGARRLRIWDVEVLSDPDAAAERVMRDLRNGHGPKSVYQGRSSAFLLPVGAYLDAVERFLA